MRYFCTYFDHNFLTRSLALYESLSCHVPAFKIWMLCFDDLSYTTIQNLRLPHVIPISLDTFEQSDDALLVAKQNRSPIEYYFTCTPALPRYVLNHYPEVDLIAYIDADLYFYSDLTPIYEEFADASIMLIPHRFAPKHQHLEEKGRYNVQFLLFRRDAHGLAALDWYYEQCLDWCYDELEEDRYADQKYLDQFPRRFEHVLVLQHRGAGVAPWNVGQYTLHHDTGQVWVDDVPLIFYHFHGFRFLRNWLMKLNVRHYDVSVTRSLIRLIYLPYANALARAAQHLGRAGVADKIPRAWGDYRKRYQVLISILKRELILIRTTGNTVYPLIW